MAPTRARTWGRRALVVTLAAAGLNLVGGVAPSIAACVADSTLTNSAIAAPKVTRDSEVVLKRITRASSQVWVGTSVLLKGDYRFNRTASLCDGRTITDTDTGTAAISVAATSKAVVYGPRSKARTREAIRKATRKSYRVAYADALSRMQPKADSLATSWSRVNPVIDPRIVRSELFRLVNERRATLGLDPLKYLPQGEALADQWAQRDADLELVEHDNANPDVDGYDADLMSLGCLDNTGPYSENLYMIWSTGLTETGLAKSAINAWLRVSPQGGNNDSPMWLWTTVGVGKGPNHDWAIVQRFSADDCSNLVP